METGLNLLQFLTIIRYETQFSTYTTQQASARSLRLNQDKEVRIYRLVYANTLQERVLKLVDTRADASDVIYGEPAGGNLSALNVDSSSVISVLARDIHRSDHTKALDFAFTVERCGSGSDCRGNGRPKTTPEPLHWNNLGDATLRSLSGQTGRVSHGGGLLPEVMPRPMRPSGPSTGLSSKVTSHGNPTGMVAGVLLDWPATA